MFEDVKISDLLISEYSPANEELDKDLSMSEDPNMSMKIKLVDDELISLSKLKRATNHISFAKSAVPTEDGLFSQEIFGLTPEERQRTFAYIDLCEKFFHPYVFEILKFLIPKKFEKCAAGNSSWYIDENGTLTEITDSEDSRYDENNTGVKWLVENFNKLSFLESSSLLRKDRIKFINSLKESEIFVKKWIVLPVFYRDLDKNSSVYKLPEINVEYNNIIRYSNSLRSSTFDFFNNQIRWNIQKELVSIRKRGQSLLEKKHGFFHKSILGKSIDRGSRDVISTPVLQGMQRPEDNPIDIFHSGIPLAKCLILGYDFILRYCLQFFQNNFKDAKKYPIYQTVDGEYKIVGEIPIKNQLDIFTADYITKKINRFKNSHETRFELIEIETAEGSKIPFHFSGQFSSLFSKSPDASTILTRPMTWTDLFYMAAANTLSDKYIYITRYPITSHNSIYPTQCFPLSTIKTCGAEIEGVEYKYYPIIDFSAINISNLFNDTVTFSNLFLSALGGDYDGDTTSEKLCFSLEANVEAEEISQAIKSFVTPEGKLLRTIEKEPYLTFFNMTRDTPVGGILSKDLKEELLKLKKSELTVNKIAKLFGNTTKLDKTNKQKSFDVQPPKFNPRAKFVLNAGEYTNKEQIVTTVGRFLFNKLLLEGNIDHLINNGYLNETVNKNKFEELTGIIATALMDGTIGVKPHVVEFLTANEFWGLSLITIFSASYSLETIIPNKELMALKTKLLDESEDKSLSSLVGIEETLLQEASKKLEGNYGKFLFDSGARGSFENDYKNMSISVGPVKNQITGEYDFMLSSYMGGIAKKDIPAAANIIVEAEYPKGIGTAKGGYLLKQFYAVYQSILLDLADSDCGTKEGLEVILTKKNLKDYVDQYLITKNGLVLITRDLSSEYLNKSVVIRSPMYCTSDKLCSKCAGKRFYKVGIDSLGLTTPALTGSLMNASLKLRHNMKIKMNKVDIDTLLV